jgi:Zn-finger protein
MSSETTVIIHGSLWDYSHVQPKIDEARTTVWQKAKWQARPALVGKAHGTKRPYTGQAFESKDYEIVPDGWSHDHCDICWWTISVSEKEEDGTGYTDGRGNWLCMDCHDRFVQREEPNQLGVADQRSTGKK